MDDFDDLLGGGEGGGDLGAEGPGADVLDELVDDGEVDVGLEQGETDLAEGLGDVLVGDGALAAEVFEGALELVGEVFKHTALSLQGTGIAGEAGLIDVDEGASFDECDDEVDAVGVRAKCSLSGFYDVAHSLAQWPANSGQRSLWSPEVTARCKE